jgi:hypothetical protein
MTVAMPLLSGSDARRPTHCPRCSTRVRGDVPWCLACYARLHDGNLSVEQPVRKPPEDPGPATPAAPGTAGRAAPATASQTTPALASAATGQTGSAPDVDEVAARLLAELAASGDRPAWAGRLPTTPAGRAVLIAGLLAAGCAVLLSAMALVGLAL